MFGISTTELLIIMLVALIVLGPTKLPGIARSLGKALGEFRRVTTDVQRTLNLEAARIEEEEKKTKPSVKLGPGPEPQDIPPPKAADPNPYVKQQAVLAQAPENAPSRLDETPKTEEKA